jgi:hypothetical protein
VRQTGGRRVLTNEYTVWCSLASRVEGRERAREGRDRAIHRSGVVCVVSLPESGVLYPSTSQVGDPPTSREGDLHIVHCNQPPALAVPPGGIHPPTSQVGIHEHLVSHLPALPQPAFLPFIFKSRSSEVQTILKIELHQVMSSNHLISIPRKGRRAQMGLAQR